MFRKLSNRVIAIDTSAVIALKNPTDKFHQQATYFFHNTKGVMWIVLNATTHETYTRIRYDKNLESAIGTYDWLRSDTFRIIDFEAADENEARNLLEKYKDQKFSFHDALYAAMMLRIGMYRIFTFDSHFWALGLKVEPGMT